ncbi:MAG: hypothetical protein GW947_01070 [Candidatus Pacebacteria bacterium]|nr:hypothetical protein [Candidatus Paceibacterota bacterium]PIR60737.1 MAG: hypothetical protein COU68_02315 [Candidatus Pacebacteria bacterium CG10_big_fil_rev_8_21_14_0_10_45_6]
MNQTEAKWQLIDYIYSITEKHRSLATGETRIDEDDKSLELAGFRAVAFLGMVDKISIDQVCLLLGTDPDVIKYLRRASIAGEFFKEHLYTKEIDAFFLYCLSILTTPQIGEWYGATKTAAGQWIRKSINVLKNEHAGNYFPNLLLEVPDVRFLKRPGVYSRLLHAKVAQEVAESLIAGRKIEDYQSILAPEIYTLAKKILNEFDLREKWNVYDYTELERLLSQRWTKQLGLNTLTVRTAEAAEKKGLVISVNRLYRDVNKMIDKSLVRERLKRNKVPYIIITRQNGSKTINTAASDLQTVITIFNSRNLETKYSLRAAYV